MITPFKLPDNKVPIKVGDESYIYKDVYNPIEWVSGEPFRPRVETLLLDGSRTKVFAHVTDKGYRIPGGSIDADSTYEQQAENETNEEALLGVMGLKYSGISYSRPMDRDWLKKGGDGALAYVGSINYVYVAIVNGHIDKSTIEEKDLDNDMAEKGKFYDIRELKLDREHIEALIHSGMVETTYNAYLNMKLDETSYKSASKLIFESGNDLGPLKKRYIFHGSTHKFDIFHPMSLDLGNTNEKPGWSTFCFDDIDYTRRFALMRAMQKFVEPLVKKVPAYKVGWDLRNYRPYINREVFVEVMNKIAGTPLYIYTIDATHLELGVGNDERFIEYTFRKDNVPFETREVVYVDKNAMLDDVTLLDGISADDFEKEQMENISNLNRGWLACMLNRDYSGDSAVAKLTSAVTNGDLKPGDDVEEYMREHKIELKEVGFFDHLNENAVIIPTNKDMTIYLGDNKMLLSAESTDENFDIAVESDESYVLPKVKDMDSTDVVLYRYYMYGLSNDEDPRYALGMVDIIKGLVHGDVSEAYMSEAYNYIVRVFVIPRCRRHGLGDVLANYAIRYIMSEHGNDLDEAATMVWVDTKVSLIKGIDKWIQSKGLMKWGVNKAVIDSNEPITTQVYSKVFHKMFCDDDYHKERLLQYMNEGVEVPETMEGVVESCKSINDARNFIKDVRKLAEKYDADFFCVTNGASGYHNTGEPAVKNARDNHMQWERENGFDPDEDWVKVWRVTYNGVGIYEAYKLAVSKDKWIKFKKSSASKWLPLPPKYGIEYRSYFTYEGLQKFNKLTLPVISKVLDSNQIVIEEIPSLPQACVVYRDEYQVVVSGVTEGVLPVLEEDGNLTKLLLFKATPVIRGDAVHAIYNWSMSQYSHTMEDAIKAYIDEWNTSADPEDQYKAGEHFRCHMYTRWEDEQSKYIGTVSVRVFKNDKFDWEWVEYPAYSKKFLDYIIDEQRSMIRVYERAIESINYYDLSKLDVTDSMVVEESWEDNKYLKPIYIILTYAGTRFGKLITAWQHCKFSHAGMSFSSKMDKVYTFNMRTEIEDGKKKIKGGADIENLGDYYNPAENNDADICVMAMFVPPDVHDMVKKNIEKIFASIDKTKYSVGNVINIVINRAVETKDSMKMICSQFVDYILKSVNIDISHKASNITTPNDFYLAANSNPNIFLLYDGKKSQYNPRSVDRKIGHIRHSDKYGDIRIDKTVTEAVSSDRVTYSSSQSDIDKIIKSMSDWDKYYIGVVDDKIYNEPRAIYKDVLLVDGNPVAYLMCYVEDKDKSIGHINLGTKPTYRKCGYASILIGRLKNAKLPGTIKSFEWDYDADNEASKATAEKNGFSENGRNTSKGRPMIMKSEIYEGYEPIEENVIFNKDNVMYDVDKFVIGKSNILLITGLSGSGKSTLAAQMAKDNDAEVIELDVFEHCYGYEDKNLHQAGEVFVEYLTAHKELWADLKAKNYKKMDFHKELTKFVKYAIKWCKHHKEKKWVIEGVQIYSCLSAKEAKMYPLIIMGTSAQTSILQRFKRNAGGENIDWGKELKNEFANLIEWYWEEEKHLMTFKKAVREGGDIMVGYILMENVYTDITVKKEWYYTSPDGISNCLVTVDGINGNLRGRGEMIIFNKDHTKIFLCKVKRDSLYYEFGYRFPGGSFEPNEPHIDGVRREVAEEALMLCDEVRDTGIRYAFTYDKPATWVQEKLPKDAWWYGSYVEVFCGTYYGKYGGDVEDIDVDAKMLNDGKWYPINKETLKMLTKWHRDAVTWYLDSTLIESLNLLLEAEENDKDKEDDENEATDYTDMDTEDESGDNDETSSDTEGNESNQSEDRGEGSGGDSEDDEDSESDTTTDNGDTATDYTDETDNDEPTDYTNEVEDEPAEQSDDGTDAGSEDVESSDEPTNSNTDGEGENTEDSSDDSTGDEGATDYTDMDDDSGEESSEDSDSESDDSSSDTGDTEGTDNQNINNRIKNYSILKDFETLYRLANEIGDTLDPIIMEKPIQNKVVTQVKENIIAIKNAIMWFVQYGMSDKYPHNLYYYEVYLNALMLNVHILEKNKKFSEELKQKLKKNE